MVCHKVVIGSFVRLRVLQARDTGAFVAESSSRAEPPAAAEGRSRGTRPLVLPLPGATSSARPCSYGGRRTVDGAGRGARAARSCRWRQARGTGRPLWRRPGGAGRLPERPEQGTAALRLPASGHVAVQCGTARAAPHAHPEFAAWGPSLAPHRHSHAARMSQRMTVCLSSAAVTEHHGRRGSSTAETHFSRLWQLVGRLRSQGSPLPSRTPPSVSSRGWERPGGSCFSSKGTNPIQGPSRPASPPPATVTVGTVPQHMHLGDTNIRSNTAGKGRMGRPDPGQPHLGKRALGNCPEQA